MKFSAPLCHKKKERNSKKQLHRLTGVIAENSKLFSNLVPSALSYPSLRSETGRGGNLGTMLLFRDKWIELVALENGGCLYYFNRNDTLFVYLSLKTCSPFAYERGTYKYPAFLF